MDFSGCRRRLAFFPVYLTSPLQVVAARPPPPALVGFLLPPAHLHRRTRRPGGEGVADEKRYQIASTNKHVIIGRGMVDDAASRRATFGEHSGGLLREAQELAVLCEAEVGVLVFDSAGRQLDYCSPHTSYMESDTVKKISVEGRERFREVKYYLILIIVDMSGRHKQEAALFEEMRQVVQAMICTLS